MAKKFNQELLNEEVRKFRLISEYSFYSEQPEDEDNLLLGNIDEEDNEDANADVPPTNEPVDGPVDDSKTNQPSTDVPTDDLTDNSGDDSDNLFGTDGGDETNSGTDLPPEAPIAPEPQMPPVDDGVEVDVTQLVQGSEEAKKSADIAGHKTSQLMNKFSDLEKKVDSMARITHKIDALEKEIVKRNPTPIEKLEMRSLDSYPFNVKLSDYWKDVDGYDTGTEDKPKEYVLTKDDIDGGFLTNDIKNSFNPKTNDYEEEDI